MAVVAFDSFGFTVRYPEFQEVSSLQLAAYFIDAGLYCDNSDQSRIVNLMQRQSLLWMMTAHIAFLSGAIDCNNVKPVGRVSSAEEGSVKAELEYMTLTAGSGPWFQQTQYGAAFWQATASFRGFRYKVRSTLPW